MRSDRLRLLDALEQIDLILKFAKGGQEAFRDDELVQSAILHRLTLLGEACRGLSGELCVSHWFINISVSTLSWSGPSLPAI